MGPSALFYRMVVRSPWDVPFLAHCGCFLCLPQREDMEREGPVPSCVCLVLDTNIRQAETQGSLERREGGISVLSS